MSDKDLAAMTAEAIKNMSDNATGVQLGIEISDALSRAIGIDAAPPFTLVFALPDGSLTRFTNLNVETSMLMIADMLHTALREGAEKTIEIVGTRQ